MSLVCCFGCLSVCGCKNVVCRKLVFFPPVPAMYALEEKMGQQVRAAAAAAHAPC